LVREVQAHHRLAFRTTVRSPSRIARIVCWFMVSVPVIIAPSFGHFPLCLEDARDPAIVSPLTVASSGRSGEPDRLRAPTGTAVFPHPTKDTTPLALRTNVKFNGVLHDRVVIVSVMSENVPYAPLAALAPGAETVAVVILPVVTSGSCSGPRWLMALADCDATEMLGAFDAGIG